MKILYYNWTPLGGVAGGGVADYLVEMIGAFIEKRPQDEIWFLNSGRRYDKGALRIERYESDFKERVHTYEVINSPILAPGRQSPVNFAKYINDEAFSALVSGFIINNGAFDVIHLHNIEGLSLKCLYLKEYLTDTKIILTLHNYFPFCPEVNLWRGDKASCTSEGNRICDKCFSYANYDLTRFRFSHLDIPKLKEIFFDYSGKNPDTCKEKIHEAFINENIKAINEHFDKVLCVSERTRQIAKDAGINEALLVTSYAGSRAAGVLPRYVKRKKSRSNVFHMLYLGYASKEKGFDFFMESLEAMEDELKSRLAVTVVSKMDDKCYDAAKGKLKSSGVFKYELINGYKDDEDLMRILNEQDLGVVPVLWEDNLPRVAMEMVAGGLAILTSDLGGAKELGGENPHFIFKAGDTKDFISKLTDIVNNREHLEEYFTTAKKPVTMDEHVGELISLYEGKM